MYVYIHVTLIFTVTWQVDKHTASSHFHSKLSVDTVSTASLLQSVVFAWSERTDINYMCLGNKNCCYAHTLMIEYWTIHHADFWVTNHRTCWYMFLNKWTSSAIYTVPYIIKLVSNQVPVLNLCFSCFLKILWTFFNWCVYPSKWWCE